MISRYLGRYNAIIRSNFYRRIPIRNMERSNTVGEQRQLLFNTTEKQKPSWQDFIWARILRRGMGPIHNKHLVSCCRFRMASAAAKTGISERQTTQQTKIICAFALAHCARRLPSGVVCCVICRSLMPVFAAAVLIRFDIANHTQKSIIFSFFLNFAR